MSVSIFRSHVPQKCVFSNLCRCRTKRRTGGQGPTNPSFGMAPTTSIDCIFIVIWKEGFAEPYPPILLVVPVVWQQWRSFKTHFCSTGPSASSSLLKLWKHFGTLILSVIKWGLFGMRGPPRDPHSHVTKHTTPIFPHTGSKLLFKQDMILT